MTVEYLDWAGVIILAVMVVADVEGVVADVEDVVAGAGAIVSAVAKSDVGKKK